MTSVAQVGSSAQEPRVPLYHEALRPQFHITARYWDEYQLHPPNHHEGWLNDMNGLVFNAGEYHFFAQRWWSAWLHAISTDLIHWEELPPAFGKGGRFGGTQSGGCVVDRQNSSGLGDGNEPPMLAFWSSTDNLNQCMSYSRDRGRTWTKYEHNPVLVHPFRDPNVFWYEPGQVWVLILYGPADEEPARLSRYGFNGESNDAHDLHAYQVGTWQASVLSLDEDGTVVVTDQTGRSSGHIDAARQNVGSEAFTIGAKAGTSEFLNGDIAALLVYDRALSDDEAADVVGALRCRWGLADPDQVGVPTIPVSGLVLHLDATDVVCDDAGKVSIWPDHSERGCNLAQSIPGCMPTRVAAGLGDRPVLRFDGGQYLQGSGVLAEGDCSFSMVALWRRRQAEGSEVVCEQNTLTKEDGRRAALLTTCQEERENHYLLFTSTNLLDWTKLDTSIPDSFECPDMFALPLDGDRDRETWVVVDGNGDYVIGAFDGRRFDAETAKRKGDYGRNFYATMTFENMPVEDGRRIQMAWMRGWDDYPKTMPFNQQASFPCELSLRTLPEGITMCRWPIREIATIRTKTLVQADLSLHPGENPLASTQGELLDIEVAIDISRSTCTAVDLTLHGNLIAYDVERRLIRSCGSETRLEPRSGMIEIRVLLDRLSVETFGNRGEVSITNIARQQEGAAAAVLTAVGGEARIVSLAVHNLTSIWK